MERIPLEKCVKGGKLSSCQGHLVFGWQSTAVLADTPYNGVLICLFLSVTSLCNLSLIVCLIFLE